MGEIAQRGGNLGALIALCLISAVSTCAFAAAPARVASLNLCTDSMLLELAPPTQIAAVTTLARDPALSPLASRAKQVPVTRGFAEEVVRLQPDLIITGTTSTAGTNALLSRLGYRIELFESAHDLDTFKAGFRRVAGLLGESKRAERLLGTLAQRVQAGTMQRERVTALIVGPNGFVPGPETLADDLLAAVGMINLAPALGLSQGGFVTLEALIRLPPQWLLVSNIDPTKPALANDFLAHPALRQLLAGQAKTLTLPESLWACGGTYFADAVDLIVGGVRRSALP